MTYLSKNWPALLLLLAGIIATVATFFSSKQDQQQKDNIENLSKSTNDLSIEIKKLQGINNSVSSNTEKMVAENKLISEDAKNLISEVQALTKATNILLNKLDIKTDKEFAQNAISGELKIEFDELDIDNQKVFIVFGGMTMEESISGIGNLISINGFSPLTGKIVENKLLISLKPTTIKYTINNNK